VTGRAPCTRPPPRGRLTRYLGVKHYFGSGYASGTKSGQTLNTRYDPINAPRPPAQCSGCRHRWSDSYPRSRRGLLGSQLILLRSRLVWLRSRQVRLRPMGWYRSKRSWRCERGRSSIREGSDIIGCSMCSNKALLVLGLIHQMLYRRIRIDVEDTSQS
jgi:hypothetical protein